MLLTIFKRYFMPMLSIASILLVVPPQVHATRQEAKAILPTAVYALAKQTVVKIESSDGSFGSGVIIGRTERGTKNIYTVLTVAHVVNCPSCKYRVLTPVPIDNSGEKKRINVDLDMQNHFQKLPNVDLATVSFETDRTFAIGTIGNSEYADQGSPIYVAGFPKPGQALKRGGMQFTGGMISSRVESEDRDPNNRNNGYELAYTNITRVGMSGGPVYDAAGRIVAIHGQGDRNSQDAESGGKNDTIGDEKTGFNLGIPMQTFLSLQPQSVTIFGAKIDDSPIDYQLQDRSQTIGTPDRKFIEKSRTRGQVAPLLDITKFNVQVED